MAHGCDLEWHCDYQPSLHAALRDGATISGSFSQREINQLAADLKAGSLSFTPRILSEENVSPELGQEEREKGLCVCCRSSTWLSLQWLGITALPVSLPHALFYSTSSSCGECFKI